VCRRGVGANANQEADGRGSQEARTGWRKTSRQAGGGAAGRREAADFG
jgi:hypothetical protein